MKTKVEVEKEEGVWRKDQETTDNNNNNNGYLPVYDTLSYQVKVNILLSVKRLSSHFLLFILRNSFIWP